MTKAIWTVKTWQGCIGQFSTKKAASTYAKQRREADRQAGIMFYAKVVKQEGTK